MTNSTDKAADKAKSMNPPDHFSSVARAYAQARPHYPPELFEWLATLSAGHALAWDCGAGSGQASIALARHFDRIAATDLSAAQIAQAAAHPAVTYRVAPAEASGLGSGTVDLVAVAQALHWFDHARFFAEVARVLAPGGAFAAWTYGTLSVEDEPVNGLIQTYYHETVGPYWPPERRHVEDGYRSIPFPFTRIDAPLFRMALDWTLPELLAYFRSWSATARYVRDRGQDPVVPFGEQLSRVWGDADVPRRIVWPLTVLAGRPRS